KRIINYPVRKIGGTTIDKIIFFAGEQGCSLWDIACNTASFKEFGASAVHIDNFVMMLRSFQSMQDSHNAYDLASHVAKQTTLLKTLYEDKTVEGISRYENIVELLNAIKEFTEDDTSEVEKTLTNFLQEVALYTDADKENENNHDRVTLMTVHGAKGLEFPYVFVTGMEENLFPSQLALNSREDLEEERRLFYVAITRAQKKLMLSFATSRFRFGNLIHCDSSRFLQEIDAGHLEYANVPPTAEISRPTGIYGRETSFALRDKKTGKQTFSSPAFAPNPNFVAEPVFDLAVGQKIEHQRFGKGEVKQIEGFGDSKKAVINFDLAGEKTLVLKFAKMRKL
ncbi:MAG: ATP-binding domain-containing protein, partial [Bacteroidia bacterium]|nr:ATP-binding domain-containing protein [Bacteroidia bacterium]